MIILILIIGISLLILIHEAGHFVAAKSFGILVEEFGIGFPPRLLSKKIGETVYSINLLPFGGFVRIHGEKPEFEKTENIPERSFAHLKLWKRATIIGAGIVMNFFLGWFILTGVYMVGVEQGILINHIDENTPAMEVGLLAGDKIIGFEDTTAFIAFIDASQGKEISMHIVRGGDEQEIVVTPRVNPPEGEGALGIGLTDVEQQSLPFFVSLWEGLMTSLFVIGAICASLWGLIAGIFTGGGPSLENFVGPVGIFGVAENAAQFGLTPLLHIIGLISLNLVVLNVLPIPALDGGRLLFLLIEKIKGSPLSPKREVMANAIGFVALLLLMVVVTARDIFRLF